MKVYEVKANYKKNNDVYTFTFIVVTDDLSIKNVKNILDECYDMDGCEFINIIPDFKELTNTAIVQKVELKRK